MNKFKRNFQKEDRSQKNKMTMLAISLKVCVLTKNSEGLIKEIKKIVEDWNYN